MPNNPFLPFIERYGFVMLDGGLATTLEAHGCNLDDPLWSANTLLESPDRITAVHREFLEAGADCIATATYQATIPGFRRRGMSDARARAVLEMAADIACRARDEFWATSAMTRRSRPLVAGSIGPYGAYLADGSEYRGEYDLEEGALYEFHQERWHILAGTDVDLIGCETIPSRAETAALLRLLRESPNTWAWLSFTCRDARHISDGTPIGEVAALCESVPNVGGVGVNCVPPSIASQLIEEFRQFTRHPIIVYPNSGEGYDADRKTWTGSPAPADAWPVAHWLEAGASIIGGCCRVMPEAIAAMRAEVERLVG